MIQISPEHQLLLLALSHLAFAVAGFAMGMGIMRRRSWFQPKHDGDVPF